MEQPKRISLNSSVAWFEEDSLSMDDHWGDFLGDESSYVLEGQHTAAFLTSSWMEASRADVSDDEDRAFHSADDDSIPSWKDAVFRHNNEISRIADPSQTTLSDASTSWAECRRKLALSMERSKTTRFWIESNIIQFCNQTTKEALLKTLQSTALMESILQQPPEQCPWFIIDDEPSPLSKRCTHLLQND